MARMFNFSTIVALACNALNDVIATKECYFYMVEQGFF